MTDLDLIEKKVKDDGEIDHLYHSLYNELVDFMKSDPGVVDQAVRFLLISRYLERIADHVTNIAERVFYVETGELKELHTWRECTDIETCPGLGRMDHESPGFGPHRLAGDGERAAN